MIVMLAGLGASVDGTWGAVLPLLADLGPFPVAIPGIGGEPVPGDDWTGSLDDILGALERATRNTGPFDLLGHSMGGSIAIAFTARWPGRVRRLIVAEPNLSPNQGVFSGQVVRWGEEAYVERGHGKVSRAMDLAARRGEGHPGFAVSVAASDPRLLHRAATWLRATDFAAIASTLTCPRLFIGGDDANPDDPATLGFDVVSMPGTGHVMMRDDPERFAGTVRDWLNDDVPAPSVGDD
jgi:pimeloyl-ACP methyl ester carboxylesterase